MKLGEHNLVRYMRALLDFMTIAAFPTIDEDNLSYLDYAVDRLNKYKYAWPKEIRRDWNYPKWHVLSHYTESIRRWGAPNGSDTAHLDAPHHYLLKVFWERTNKGPSAPWQITALNTREVKLQAMQCRLALAQGYFLIQPLDEGMHQTTLAHSPCLATEWGYPKQVPPHQLLLCRSLGLNPKLTTSVSVLEASLGLIGFARAMKDFIRTNRQVLLKQDSHTETTPEAEVLGVEDFPVEIYNSLRCWKYSGRDERSTLAVVEETVRCAPNWRNNRSRKDHCWVQEDPADTGEIDGKPEHLQGKRVGQLQCLFRIFDTGIIEPSTIGLPLSYTGACVDLYGLIDHGRCHRVHGMVELSKPQVPQSTNFRILKNRHIYTLPAVLRSAHICPAEPAGHSPPTRFFVNNYIDWDQYNILYNPTWEEDGREDAEQFYRCFKKDNPAMSDDGQENPEESSDELDEGSGSEAGRESDEASDRSHAEECS
jgi:hypothetical protein